MAVRVINAKRPYISEPLPLPSVLSRQIETMRCRSAVTVAAGVIIACGAIQFILHVGSRNRVSGRECPRTRKLPTAIQCENPHNRRHMPPVISRVVPLAPVYAVDFREGARQCVRHPTRKAPCIFSHHQLEAIASPLPARYQTFEIYL